MLQLGHCYEQSKAEQAKLGLHAETKDAGGRKVCRFYAMLGAAQCWKQAECPYAHMELEGLRCVNLYSSNSKSSKPNTKSSEPKSDSKSVSKSRKPNKNGSNNRRGGRRDRGHRRVGQVRTEKPGGPSPPTQVSIPGRLKA